MKKEIPDATLFRRFIALTQSDDFLLFVEKVGGAEMRCRAETCFKKPVINKKQ